MKSKLKLYFLIFIFFIFSTYSIQPDKKNISIFFPVKKIIIENNLAVN